MSKKCYRFFGGLLNAQAKWLNKMSEKPVVILNDSIPTTKPEPQLHGFGLVNIHLILEKYHGEHTMFYENGWFQFTADIPFTPIS